MKPNKRRSRRTMSIVLPEQLATDLRTLATREANRESVVARRLIAIGLSRELRPTSQTPEGEAA